MDVKILKVKFGTDFRLTQLWVTTLISFLELGDYRKGIQIKLLSAVATSNFNKKATTYCSVNNLRHVIQSVIKYCESGEFSKFPNNLTVIICYMLQLYVSSYVFSIQIVHRFYSKHHVYGVIIVSSVLLFI
jgi:hypothetical protein